MTLDGEITDLLRQWRAGDPEAEERLLTVLYPALRAMAANRLAGRGHGATLDTQDLVHEAYLKLLKQDRSWENRAHFLAISARVMRRIVLDKIRSREREKRGGGAIHLSLTEAQASLAGEDPDWLELDLALEELSQIDPRAERVVELRFFGGVTTEESALVLGVSSSTVERAWRFARAWLGQRLV